MANEKRNVSEWLAVLSEASKGKHYPALYKKVYGLLSAPSRRRNAISLEKLRKYTSAGENVIVPRKVLGTGKIDHKVKIAALEFSSSAKAALQAADCEFVDIKEMVKRDKVRLIV